MIPCHNEEMNVRRSSPRCVDVYDRYIHEIIIVDDNSTDRTADVVARSLAHEPRIKLVRRTPPNGVGRALRDGYAAATGRYILTMDCDFVLLVPELRDLFDAWRRARRRHRQPFLARIGADQLPVLQNPVQPRLSVLVSLMLPGACVTSPTT